MGDRKVRLFHPYVTDHAALRVAEVLGSGWIGLGSQVAAFEKNFAEYIGVKYAVATTSATTALHLATIVSGFKPDQEVITTPITFVSTNSVLLQENLHPCFADVEKDTLNIDPDSIRNLIGPTVAGIMVVHYGGNPANLDEIYSIAEDHNLKVIEDAAHACGAVYKGRKIGAQGLTCFSFHAVKNLPLGDGGMITTNDEEIYNRLLRLRWSGIDKSTYDREGVTGYKWEYDVVELGYKYYMNDITASIGLEQLKHLDDWNVRRQEIVDRYKKNINAEFLSSNGSSNHLCVVKVNDRNNVASRLMSRGIETGVHYKPNTEYRIFDGCERDFLKNTYNAYEEIMSLPLHLNLTDDDVEYVSEEVNACRNRSD